MGVRQHLQDVLDGSTIVDRDRDDGVIFGKNGILNTSLVNDRKMRTAALSEKADGEVTFQSVFDPKKVTKSALPRVPGLPVVQDAARTGARSVTGLVRHVDPSVRCAATTATS